MRILPLLGISLVFSATIAHAAPSKRSTNNTHQEKIKVKLYLAANYQGLGDGLLVEYKLTEKIGLQSGVEVNLQAYPIWTSATTKNYLLMYAEIPLTLRYYVGESKQFCWFGGINSYYFVCGLLGLTPADTANRYQMSINVGFDYETNLGFIGGINLYEQELIYMAEKPAELKYPRILGLMVGYNFARLFYYILGDRKK